MQRREYNLLIVLLFVVFTSISIQTSAQEEQSLGEITVIAIKPERFMVGQKVRVIDSALLAQSQFTTLANFLQFQAPISFKTYGAGQASSISFRGTSASHTAVLWNGININFPSLGQTDFSTMPLTGFDEMSIQYGSAASCVGTDAIGGSILLRSVPKFNQNGIQTIVGMSAESSKNFSGQTGVRFYYPIRKQWKISGKTLFYGSNINNDFGDAPIRKKSGLEYPTEPAQTIQKGFIQDIYVLKSTGNMFSLNIWLTDNNLEIQPKNITLREITQTSAQRFVLSYNFGKTLLRAAYINDITNYGKAQNLNPSHTDINRYILRVEHDFSWTKSCNSGTNIKIGGEMVQYMAEVDGYGNAIKKEKRADFYALLRHQFNQKISSSLNLRQAFVEGYNPPFTPSLGIDYLLGENKTDRINISSNLAYSYRVPTLNERYWANLGNPDLKPEVSFNKEVGLVWKRRTSEKLHQQYGISAFHNLIDNWTYWNPDKNYRVENLQQVLAKGLELEASQFIYLSKSIVNTQFQYALTNSSQQKTFGAYTQDILGKQLIYVPRHTFNSTIGITKGLWTLTAQQLYHSKRYITFDHSGQAFPGYYLLNVWMAYKLKFKNHHLNIQAQGNNLTNTLYANLKKNAMPMRSVSLNLIFVFNQVNK